MKRIAPEILVCLLVAAGCNCGDDNLKKLRDTQLTITSPADGSNAAASVHFAATATNSGGLQWVSLRVGTDEIASCQAGADPSQIDCAKDFNVADEASQASNDSLVLTAVTRDSSDQLVQKSVKVLLGQISVTFTAPSANNGVANVRGTSPVTLAVKSATGVAAVGVTFDTSTTPIAQWRSAQATYSQSVNWEQALGNGRHTLHAVARDPAGLQATADLVVNVTCGGDTDCPTGQRCCTASGKCNPIVGAGDDCDCDHPCPTDQGCFPGTCGTNPRKCRPGCFPGDENTKEDRCAKENQGGQLVTAYCSALPASERTAQNKGGACAPADNCSITQQNCPDAPLDRNQPASPSNPNVHYSCVPVSPVANACLPAGNIALHGQNCTYDTCGDNSAGCQKGLICVTPVDQNDNPIGPATCEAQCTDPTAFPLGDSPDCPRGEFCGIVMGAGREQYPTGTCESGGF